MSTETSKYRVRFVSTDTGETNSVKVPAGDEVEAMETARKWIQAMVGNGMLRPTRRRILGAVPVDE